MSATVMNILCVSCKPLVLYFYFYRIHFIQVREDCNVHIRNLNVLYPDHSNPELYQGRNIPVVALTRMRSSIDTSGMRPCNK